MQKKSTFYWGAATSAHQVEGNNRNDWSAWEPEHARKMAFTVQQAYAKQEWVWEDRDGLAGREETYRSGLAADHYHRYAEDIELMGELGLNAYRFSLEWSRIEPLEGVFDEEEVSHYQAVVRELRKQGMEPFVTLWHYTLPGWLAEKGGWANPEMQKFFLRYVEKMTAALPEVKFWTTMNEPEVYLAQAYVTGETPPQQKNWLSYLLLLGRVIRTHRAAYLLIKRINPESQVGLAKDVFYFDPVSSSPFNLLAKFLLDRLRNYYLFYRLRGSQDYLGLNYYIRYQLNMANIFIRGKKVLKDLGWQGAPPGLGKMLGELATFRIPLYILENGTIDWEDEHRGGYIEQMVDEIKQAKKVGIPVQGYFHWSLLDCFEWRMGYRLRFGLIEVDFANGLARRVKKSAKRYAELIRKSDF